MLAAWKSTCLKNQLTSKICFQEYKQDPRNTKKKKIIVGTVGSAVIAVLAVLFVHSLKQVK